MLKRKAMRWVKALRSGKYKQGKGLLVQTSPSYNGKEVVRHCCLGVLAEINGFKRSYLIEYEILSANMLEKCGLDNCEGTPINKEGNRIAIELKGGYVEASLAEVNDEGASFKAIATWIEKNYKLL